jgi:hypothetical protein
MKYSSYVKSQIISESRNLLKSEAIIHQTLEEHKSDLGLQSEYEFKAAYLEIVEVNGIENFLKGTSKLISSDIVSAILRRIDSTGDGKINFSDFMKFLTSDNENSIMGTRLFASSLKMGLVDKENAEYSPIDEYTPSEPKIHSNHKFNSFI